MSASVTATFVFTDLVDSTATAARLGPAAAEELRQTHFRLLRGAVTGSGGVEVKNLGDGLMVMYSSPSRALAGVVGMQQAIHHHNRSATEPLGVRIGISTGEAVEEDDDYFGDPVVEAARLCAVAAGGQILAAEIVRMMVGRNATQTFVEVGPLELKGLPEPVDAVEVQWEPAQVEGSVPLPGRLVGAATDALFGFFGRGSELAALEEARKVARTDKRAQAVFVSGEAGMGKTALTAQVARTAHAQGAIVLFGHADEDLGVAYQPWIEALSLLVRDGDPAFVAALASAQRSALARLVPALSSDDARVADPDTERLLLLEATSELLAAASQHCPVLVVLDDVHWADTASLQLLRHVIASTTPMDVMIACTYRDTDLARSDPLTNLLADLRREANVSRFALAGLEDTELAELLAAAAGHDLDDAGYGLAHALRRETEGNPFFAAELLRHLSETGGIVLGDDGRWSVTGELDELGLPGSIRDVVGRRVQRLGDEALRVLCLAAVIGREFDLGALSALADVDEDELLDVMDAAVSAAVLVESGAADRYRFAHALIQHSLYDELSPARRARAHQRVAEMLEVRAGTQDAAMLGELAHHWVAATRPADLDKALGYVRRAGDAARDALAPDDAIRWYQQALELVARQTPPDEHQRAELLVALGASQRSAAHLEYRATLKEAVALGHRLDATEVIVQAALAFNRVSDGASIGDEEAKPILRAALDRVETGSAPARARLLAELANAHDAGSESEARRDLALEAVELARGSGDDATFLAVVSATHLIVGTPDRLDQFTDDVEAAVRIADGIGDPVLAGRIRIPLVLVRQQQGDMAAADAGLAEMTALCEAVRLPYVRWQVTLFECGRTIVAGHADEAEAANERLLELGNAAEVPQALATFGAILYCIRLQQGRLDEIVEFFIEAARGNPSIAALRSAVPFILCELGRIDEARAAFAAEAASDFAFPYDALWLSAMANMTDIAATVGDEAAARRLLERLEAHATQIISPAAVVNGTVARPLARAATLLGDYGRAEEWFAIAHDAHARLQAPYWIARTQLDHADLCVDRRDDGDMERARNFAEAAATTAAKYNCAGLEKRAVVLLADL